MKVKPNSSLILLSLFYGYSRSSAGYTPLDFAFVVADSKGVVEMLDHDRQLLPREEYPNLEEDVVEVRPYLMCCQGKMKYHIISNNSHTIKIFIISCTN